MTPIKAIRAKCLECSNGQFSEVRLCPCKERHTERSAHQ